MSNSHEESLPQYYNYTNKGQTYQFDLTQLTPEERKRFMKLNERQKMKIITLMDLKDDGKMKNEHDLRPAYIDEDENRRENDLRTLTAKKEATERLIEELKRDEEKKKLTLKDDALYDIIESNPEYALITKTDIDKILSVNSTATPETLKKYYEELIKDVKVEGESFRVKKAIMGHPLTSKAMQAKPELLKKLFSQTNGLLNLLVNNTQFLYPQPRNVDLSAADRAKQQQVQEAQQKLAEGIPQFIDISKMELKEILKNKDKLFNFKKELSEFMNFDDEIDGENPFSIYASYQSKPDLIDEKTDELFLGNLDEEGLKKLIREAEKTDEIKEEKINNFKELIEILSNQFGLEPLIKNNYDKNPDVFNPKSIYSAVDLLLDNRVTTGKTFPAIFEEDPNLSDRIDNGLRSYAKTMKKLSKSSPYFKEAFREYLDEKKTQTTPYKSGSIKDRVWKIFHPNADKFKEIQAESVATKDELTKAKSDIELLKNEIKDLKQEIQNISSSKGQPVKEPAKEPAFRFLNEITKPQNLRKIENSPPSKTDSSDDGIESDLRNAMIRRREDIAPDSEDEDDSEEWGEGIRRFNNSCGRAGKMKLSDYLRKM